MVFISFMLSSSNQFVTNYSLSNTDYYDAAKASAQLVAIVAMSIF